VRLFATTPTCCSAAPFVASSERASSYAFGSLVHAVAPIGTPLEVVVQLMADDDRTPVVARDSDVAELVLRGPPSSGDEELRVPLLATSGSSVMQTAADAKIALAVGVYVAYVQLNGEPVRASPFAVRVMPPLWSRDSVFSPEMSQLEDASDGASYKLVTRDAAGRPLGYGGLRLGAVLRAPDGAEHPAQVTDNRDGSYTVKARSTQVGVQELTVHRQDGTTLLQRRQVQGNDDCPHFWRALGAGASFALPATATQFFVKPFDCEGKTLAVTGIDLSDPVSAEAIRVALLGPSGGVLSDASLLQLSRLQDTGDGSFIVPYQADVCGVSQLSVRVYGKDIISQSPRRLEFTGGRCECPGRVPLSIEQGAGVALCSAHGVCKASTQLCVCERGWAGADCSTPPPPSTPARSTGSRPADRRCQTTARCR
jgi:hypothetical protein